MQRRFYTKEGSSGRRPSLIIVLFVVLVLVVFILVGLYIIGANSGQSVKKQLPSVPALTVKKELKDMSVKEATPSVMLSVDPSNLPRRNALHLVVLNGGGVAGAAGGISRYLSSKGYVVVSVGNADNYAYRNVTVLVKLNKSSYAQLLKKDLQDNGSSVSASLSDTISNDAEVIVGK